MNGRSKLARWRKTAGLTQFLAAERIGVTQASYSEWESGKAKPSLANAVEIARVTGGLVGILDWVEEPPGGAAA